MRRSVITTIVALLLVPSLVFAGHREKQTRLIDEVLRLAYEGVPEEIVVKQIYAMDFVFELTSDDILELRSLGLSDTVIEALIDTALVDDDDDGSDRVYVRISPGYYSPWYQFPYAWGCYYDPFPQYYSCYYYPVFYWSGRSRWGWYGNCGWNYYAYYYDYNYRYYDPWVWKRAPRPRHPGTPRPDDFDIGYGRESTPVATPGTPRRRNPGTTSPAPLVPRSGVESDPVAVPGRTTREIERHTGSSYATPGRRTPYRGEEVQTPRVPVPPAPRAIERRRSGEPLTTPADRDASVSPPRQGEAVPAPSPRVEPRAPESRPTIKDRVRNPTPRTAPRTAPRVTPPKQVDPPSAVRPRGTAPAKRVAPRVTPKKRATTPRRIEKRRPPAKRSSAVTPKRAAPKPAVKPKSTPRRSTVAPKRSAPRAPTKARAISKRRPKN